MKGTNFKYFILFVLSFIFSLHLHGRIIFYDCNGNVLNPRTNSNAKRHKEKAERVLKEINSNKCLPQSWLDSINFHKTSNQFPIEIQLSCDRNFNCGQGDLMSDVITIPKYYSFWQTSCGCEEATILHEMLHVFARVPGTPDGHKKIRGCEVKCTSNIPRCKKFPPPGNACDCHL